MSHRIGDASKLPFIDSKRKAEVDSSSYNSER